MVRENLLAYGASYLNFDYNFNNLAKVWNIHTFPFNFHAMVHNITHDPIRMDVSRFAFNYTHMKADHKQVVLFALPLIENFQAAFDYKIKYGLINGEGPMRFELNNTYLMGTIHFTATDKGHLYPQLHDLKVDFAQSNIFIDDNPIVQGFYREFFKVGKYLAMAGLRSFGVQIINQMLPEFTRRLTNSQVHNFDLNWPQLNKTGSFNLDWAMLLPPLIHNSVIDFDFLFDIGAHQSKCSIVGDTHDYYFQDYNS